VRLGLALAEAELGRPGPLEELLPDPDLGPWAAEPLANRAYEERRLVEALKAFEQAILKRVRVSSPILCRLAVGYLQLSRYREALPHLVELSRRYPQADVIRYNLAVCRYHLGRAHYRQSQWDLARREWARSCQLLRDTAAAEAEAVHHWEREAAYRAAARQLSTSRPAEWARAAEALQTGLTEEPAEPRWWFGRGLASALADRHAEAVGYFAEARQRSPDRVSFAVGHGLSLQAADQSRDALAALGEAAAATGPAAVANPLFPVAARFALAMSHARQRHWSEAATALQPLLDHPLLARSSHISRRDIAQAMVAYHALGGDKEKASALAREHLQDSGGVAHLADLLIGVVQADAGDYAGAADTLARAYERNQEPAVRGVLVGCLLAAAADCILKGNLNAAAPLVKRALGFDAAHAAARKLHDALSFGSRLKNLDPARLEEAIRECEALARQGERWPQVLRTLGVLYHRKAIEAEKKDRSADKLWSPCVKFWRQRIVDNDAFWARYAEDYNTAKGKREQVKPEDIEKWRKDLPNEFAAGHAAGVGSYLRQKNKAAVRRHLNLMWEWAPDYKPPEGFLLGNTQLDDSMIKLLEGLLGGIKQAEVHKTVETLVAGFWNGKGVEAAGKADMHNSRAVEMANRAVAAVNALGPYDPSRFVTLILAKGLLTQAKGEAQEACKYAEEARKYVDKAYRLAPDGPAIKKNHDAVRDVLSNAKNNLNRISDLLRQVS
jgi:hypothetical protein